jgi:hypothetical protein
MPPDDGPPPPGTDGGQPPPDLANVFTPSHAGAFDPMAADLSGISQIDTKTLKINNATPPAGVTLVKDTATNTAILTVGAFTVSTTLTVTGDKPLIILATGAVIISSPIFAGAIHHTPGPGGGGPSSGGIACSRSSGPRSPGPPPPPALTPSIPNEHPPTNSAQNSA